MTIVTGYVLTQLTFLVEESMLVRTRNRPLSIVSRSLVYLGIMYLIVCAKGTHIYLGCKPRLWVGDECRKGNATES